MIHGEFNKLLGYSVSPESYERIEYVYMNCDLFQTKQDIVEFYKKHDMLGIDTLYKAIFNKERLSLKEKELEAEYIDINNKFIVAKEQFNVAQAKLFSTNAEKFDVFQQYQQAKTEIVQTELNYEKMISRYRTNKYIEQLNNK